MPKQPKLQFMALDREVLRIIGQSCGLPKTFIEEPVRIMPVPQIKTVIVHFLNTFHGWSYSRIARASKMNHGSILKADKRYQELITYTAIYARFWEFLCDEFTELPTEKALENLEMSISAGILPVPRGFSYEHD